MRHTLFHVSIHHGTQKSKFLHIKNCGDNKIMYAVFVDTWHVRKVMTLNVWLDNWQRCSHTSDTSQDILSYLMISASFNSLALTRLI